MFQNHITLSIILALKGFNHKHHKIKSHFENHMMLNHLDERKVLYTYVVSHSSLLHYRINFSSECHIANTH